MSEERTETLPKRHPDPEGWLRSGATVGSIAVLVWQMLSAQIGDLADDLDGMRAELRAVATQSAQQAAQIPDLVRRLERVEAQLATCQPHPRTP